MNGTESARNLLIIKTFRFSFHFSVCWPVSEVFFRIEEKIFIVKKEEVCKIQMDKLQKIIKSVKSVRQGLNARFFTIQKEMPISSPMSILIRTCS